ncbi:MAG: hypothetical protein AAGA93_02810 [Actinomycetota bacterium]
MKVHISAEQVLDQHIVVGPQLDAIPIDPDPEPSERAIDWLGRLRLLNGVPFEYLVPDHGLLRPETIRFFHLDRNWTDALVDGAVAAGTFGTRDRAELTDRHQAMRDRVDDAERSQWVDPPATGAAANVTGFLLRSQAVSGWPGMHIRAFRQDGNVRRRIGVLRVERLSPAVMLAMFADIPDQVEIEEPRQGIQFGVRGSEPDDPPGEWMVDLRDPQTAAGLDPIATVAVPFRAGSAGVIHVDELRERLLQHPDSTLGQTLDSAELALQLIRYPYRQRFDDDATADYDQMLVAELDGTAIFRYMDDVPEGL